MIDYELVDVDSALPPAAFRWDLIHDAERVEMSRGLAAFVGWLVDRYRLHRQIPPCWWQHGAYVEELSALWIGWRGVMETPDRADAWLWWHDHLARLIGRCRDLWTTGCTAEEHVDTTSVPWSQLDCGSAVL